MDSLRVHTFYLDIRGIRNIKQALVYDFIADQLHLTPSEVAAIQFDLTEGKVYVELYSQERVLEVVGDYDGVLDLTVDNKVYRMRLGVEDGGTDVKLHHLPPRMPTEWITEYMERYGSVISITEQKCKSSRFPEASSGVKVIRLQLRRAIPSYISIRGYSTYVTYINQEPTCRHCGNILHRGRSCADNRLLLAEEQRKIVSYADIASGISSSKENSLNVASATDCASILSDNTLSDASMKAPSTSAQQQIKRPATNYIDIDSGKKGKSSTEHRNTSSERKQKGITNGSKPTGSHNKTERKATGGNTSIDLNISDDDQHPDIHQSRSETRTRSSTREASKNKNSQQPQK